MKTIQEVVEQVHQEAASKNVHEVREVKAMKPGQFVRQGDIYLVCVPSTHPKGDARKDRQLAPGSSKGSRHVAEEGMELFQGCKAPAGYLERINGGRNAERVESLLVGPRIKTKKRSVISHPEHAHVSLPGDCDVQVMFQLNPRTMRRVED